MSTPGDSSEATIDAMDDNIVEQVLPLPDRPRKGQGQVHQGRPPLKTFRSAGHAAKPNRPIHGNQPVGNASSMLGPNHPAMTHAQNAANFPANQVANPGIPHAYFPPGLAASHSASHVANNTYLGGYHPASIAHPIHGYYPVGPGYTNTHGSQFAQSNWPNGGMYPEFGGHQRVPLYGSYHSLKQSERLGKTGSGIPLNKRGADEDISTRANAKRHAARDNALNPKQDEISQVNSSTDGKKEPAFRAKYPKLSIDTDLEMPPEADIENPRTAQLPAPKHYTEAEMTAAKALIEMSQALYREPNPVLHKPDVAQSEASRQNKLDVSHTQASDKLVTRSKEDEFIAALKNALSVVSSRPKSISPSNMPRSPRELGPPCNSPISPTRISKTTGKAFSDHKTVRNTPRKRAPAKGFNYIEGYPIPNSWTEASDADKTLWNMKVAGKDWAAIRTAWSQMTGQTTAMSTLPNRFKRLQAAFESLKEGDDVRILQAKREIDQEIEAEKWARVALAVEKKGGAKYAPEFVKREFTRLNLACGGYLDR